MKKVDMHMHTNASDGTWDVAELKNNLIENEISIFSITDHDCVDNIKKMQDIISNKDNLIFIPGTELSAEYQGREYHLTLYNFDLNNKELLQLITWTMENKLNSNIEYISKYASKKYANVSLEDFENYQYDSKRGGWKSLNYMIDKGLHSNIIEHLRDVNSSGLKAELKAAEELIKIAKKSGGKLFLAHPSYHYKNSSMLKEELNYWLELGIDGIECFSPYNKDSNYYRDFCKRNNLMISGGSDCHGEFITARKLGLPNVRLEELDIRRLYE